MGYICSYPNCELLDYISLQPSSAAGSSGDETVEQDTEVQDTPLASSSNETSSFHEDKDPLTSQVSMHNYILITVY